jgi:glucosamine-6-phosphate deaminase
VAFNDPHADFTAFRPCIVAPLGRTTRGQQVEDGWFPSIDAVPEEAITLSISQLMKAEAIVCSAAEERRAKAVKAAVEGPVAAEVPASMLQRHPRCYLILERESAKLLKLEPARRPGK